MRYRSEVSTDKTIIARALSLLAENFDYSAALPAGLSLLAENFDYSAALPAGATSSPVTIIIFHKPSFIRAILHWIFQVG